MEASRYLPRSWICRSSPAKHDRARTWEIVRSFARCSKEEQSRLKEGKGAAIRWNRWIVFAGESTVDWFPRPGRVARSYSIFSSVERSKSVVGIDVPYGGPTWVSTVSTDLQRGPIVVAQITPRLCTVVLVVVVIIGKSPSFEDERRATAINHRYLPTVTSATHIVIGSSSP